METRNSNLKKKEQFQTKEDAKMLKIMREFAWNIGAYEYDELFERWYDYEAKRKQIPKIINELFDELYEGHAKLIDVYERLS